MYPEQKDKVHQPSVPFASNPSKHTVVNVIFPKHRSYPVTSLPENLQPLSISYWVKPKLICQAFQDSHNLAALCLCNRFFHSSADSAVRQASLCVPPLTSPEHIVPGSPECSCFHKSSRADHPVTLSLTFSDHSDHIFLWIPMAKQFST